VRDLLQEFARYVLATLCDEVEEVALIAPLIRHENRVAAR
jgi:hypothetical protein